MGKEIYGKDMIKILDFDRTTLFVCEGEYWLGNNFNQLAIPLEDEILDMFLFTIWTFIDSKREDNG